jgi:uncharacterized protein (TIGR00255 family)
VRLLVLLSMTGFGECRVTVGAVDCLATVRSVNNRYLKVFSKLPEPLVNLESEVEKLVKRRLRRGSVTVTVQAELRDRPSGIRINQPALQALLSQAAELGIDRPDGALLGPLLAIPGMIEEAPNTPDLARYWPPIRDAIDGALLRLDQMRRDEGGAMQREMGQTCQVMLELVERIEGRTGEAVAEFRDRLRERVTALVAEMGVAVSSADLIREVAILVERSDVAEETARLRSHLGQLRELLAADESSGRMLDFLMQEMNREANTVGSKANDATVAQLAMELKAQIERVREMVQNVE